MTESQPTAMTPEEQKAGERIRRAILDRLGLPYDPAPLELGCRDIPARPFLPKGIKNDE